jgi:hypothetical protein
MLHSRFAKGLTLLAALHLMGGHWLALQMVAWLGMLGSYTSEGNFSVGLAKTFDGQHPCALCQVVSSGQEKERDQKPADLRAKVHAVLPVQSKAPSPQVSTVSYILPQMGRVHGSTAPPTPPPPQLV